MTAKPSPRAAAAAAPGIAAPDVAHIGYHRTGTNFLQSEVFPALASELYVPDGSGWALFDLPPGAALDLAAAEAFYRPRREAAGAGRLLMATHESLSGTILADAAETPARLARLNPEMRVLVVLRSQYCIFPSLYHLHVKSGGALRYPDYLRRALAGGKCDYFAMVERLRGAFGRERVWVGFYEDLRGRPQDMVDDLCGFLGVASPRLEPRPAVVNRRSSAATIRARRAANALLIPATAHETGRRLTGWRRGARRLAEALGHKSAGLAAGLGRTENDPEDDPEARALIRARHAEGNRRLAGLLGRSLDELDYPA